VIVFTLDDLQRISPELARRYRAGKLDKFLR
jgi:hypothetical protein